MPLSSLVRIAGVCLLLAAPACGLALDYDPPQDGGMDVPGTDAAIDAPSPACQTDLDCANGNLCDGDERCVDRSCVEGTAIVCEDEDVCDGVATCQPATGLCMAPPVSPCADDGDLCNGEERCDAVLGCVSGPALDCDDGIDCTVDSCDGAMGCAHLPDDTACDRASGGVCQADGCQYPICDAATCTSDDPCFDAHCDEGTCVRAPIACPEAMECCNGECVVFGCDDGIECTEDRCGRRRGCVNEPRLGSCDDGNPCTLNDSCAMGACTAGPRRTCISGGGGMCIGGACDDETGECVTVPLSGVPCVDGNACTTNDACIAGVCTSGSIGVDCDDGESCTADTCSAAGGCEHAPVMDGTTCPGIVASVCIGGRCFGAMGCDAGRNDCDDDGLCECPGRCDGRLCTAVTLDCAAEDRCGTGQVCCDLPGSPANGTCVPEGCLGCCM